MTPPRSSPGAGGGNGRLRPASRLSPGRDPSSDGNGGPSIAETTSAHHLHQTSTNVSPHAGLPRMRLDTPFTGLRSSHMPRKGFTNSPLSDVFEEGVPWDSVKVSQEQTPVIPALESSFALPKKASRRRQDSAFPTAAREGVQGSPHNTNWKLHSRRKDSNPTLNGPTLNAAGGRIQNRRSRTRSVFAKSNVYSPISTSPSVPKYKQKIVSIVVGSFGAGFMTLIALWSLFGDDVRLSLFAKDDDAVFLGITYVCLTLFSAEMIALCIAKEGYALGFYFWLDLVATLSMLLDVPSFMYVSGLASEELCLFVESSAGGLDILAAPDLVASVNADGDTVDGAFLRAARASRAGTRAGRIVRVVRFARVLRLVRLWHLRQVIWSTDKSPVTQKGDKKTTHGPKLANLDAPETDQPCSVVEVVVVKGNEDLGASKELTSSMSTCMNTSLGKQSEKKKTVSHETRVGQKLSELTTRRVIVGVLGMLFALPWFDLNTYPRYAEASFRENGLRVLHYFAQGSLGVTSGVTDTATSSKDTNTTINHPTGFYSSVNLYHSSTPGLYALVVFGEKMNEDNNTNFELHGAAYGSNLRCEEFRLAAYVGEELTVYNDDNSLSYNSSNAESTNMMHYSYLPSYAFFDDRVSTKTQAALNMCRTVFVCLMLGAGALFFSRDAHNLVLKPIERMVRKVREVSENPLKRFNAEDSDDDGESSRNKPGKSKKKKKKKKPPPDEQMETLLLENSIAKICGLLAVGFGEAGSEIIAANIRKGGAIDPMIPGKKMVAIFGFCDIRNFTDTTEVLQEGVMEFVNTIGKIVHMEVHLHGGSANKNIGDAFLLVWKFPEGVMLADVENPQSASAEIQNEINKVAENALASFVAIIAGLRRSSKLNTYTNDARLKKRLSGFQVNMGFGLHAGWAIEGAIGSEHKVDASYLSPNVNLSARLEAATKQFDVPILVSDTFVGLCGVGVQNRLREIDKVLVKGSSEPMGVFTFDVSSDAAPAPDAAEDPDKLADKLSDQQLGKEFTSHSFVEYEDVFLQHPDINAMRTDVTDEFLKQFKIGFELYQQGRWADARVFLQKVAAGTFRRNRNGNGVEDGPSRVLLQHMEACDWKAPSDWSGVRALTEK
ncbi:adenylate/guanylate cyclase domain-containing protein [bacterium]|nr:adenylate/guanylate cyclase domain-containing protein [bacterium]